MRNPSRATSPAADLVVLPPLSAASAAGGWGRAGSRCVYSVGPVRSPAGGAVEVVVASVRKSEAVLFPSAGWAPRSAAAGRSSPSCSWLAGATARANKPSPDLQWRRIRVMKTLLEDDGLKLRDDAGVSGCRGFGSTDRRLPVCRRASSDPRHLGSGSSGAPPACPVRRRSRDPEGPVCIFLFFLDLSVRMEF